MASSVLEPVQQRGREALQRLGLPTRRQEAWRLTDLKRLAALADLRSELAGMRLKALKLRAEGGVQRVGARGVVRERERRRWHQGGALAVTLTVLTLVG